MTNHLSGKTLVVTGAGSGFGRLVCEYAAEFGARVVGADVSAEGLDAVAEEIRAKGGEFEPVIADVTVKEQMDRLAQRTVERFGAIDVLVNNAGVMPLAFYADHADAWQAWDRCIDINVKGVVHGIAAVHDIMMAQGRGHIVNVSSIYGNAGSAGSGVYSATKAAVNVLSESLRIESQGLIKVTVVKPTGVPGTGLGGGIINRAALVGLAGQNFPEYSERVQQRAAGTLPPELADENNPRYASITPEQLARSIVYAINQPWGVSIAEITVRATGELCVI
ncbi:SDR family oxidoreductase [Streptomyces sp. NPDC050145]|uniref:SDR family oxidoreductase n=1 Tax=Streptomyces sp. NPDC050145 TaxID=3365602 RepID=UPI003794B0CD